MARAKQTAEEISKEIHVSIEYWDDLSEVRRPAEIRGKDINDEKVVKIKQIIEQNRNKKNYHFSDEENFEDINKRTQKF